MYTIFSLGTIWLILMALGLVALGYLFCFLHMGGKSERELKDATDEWVKKKKAMEVHNGV